MIELRSKNQPVQLIVKSFSKRREHAKALTVKNIPANKRVYLPEERIVDEYLERCKKWGLLSARYIPDNEVPKEEK